MSHEVYEIAGEYSMAFIQGVKPWHGLGQKIDADQPLEVWAETAHLDWTVKEASVIFNAADDQLSLAHFEGRKVLFRSDNREPLAVVSDGYHVVQPIQILEFFRNLTEIHGLKIHTAGSLKNGKRVWALASIPKGIKLGKGNLLYPFVLLATSYDKSLSTTGKLTTVEVVCNNIFSIPSRSRSTLVLRSRQSSTLRQKSTACLIAPFLWKRQKSFSLTFSTTRKRVKTTVTYRSG